MANLRVDKITSTETFETTGSVQFDGDADYLHASNSDDFQLGTGDFTVEAWVLANDSSGSRQIVSMSDGNENWQLFTHSGGTIRWNSRGTNDSGTIQHDADAKIDAKIWNHVAATRSGNTLRLFKNGIVVGTFEYNSDLTLSAGGPSIGIWDADKTSEDWQGHISNVRIIKGTALYTDNFKPPMRELEVVPGTVLLACQSKTDATLEKTGKTLTVGGNAIASELTPGILTPVPKAGGGSAITGSVEFTGNDYLIAPDSSDFEFGTEDFTIECWINASDLKYERHLPIIQKGDSTGNNQYDWRLYFNNEGSGSSVLFFDAACSGTDVSAESTSVFVEQAWMHVAVTRQSGAFKVFFNGILENTVSSTTNAIDDDYTEIIIGFNDLGAAGDSYLKGYISNLRIVKGTALYTDNFIPPTRELRKVPNTVLLCCQDPDSPLTEATGKTITGYGSLNQSYGTDLVTNGQFTADSDWSKGDQWTISGGSASITDSPDRGSDSLLTQDASSWIQAGQMYRVAVDWSFSSGDFDVRLGGDSTYTEYSIESSQSSPYIFNIEAGATNNNLAIIANQHAVGDINSIHVEHIPPSKAGSNFTPQVGDDRKVTFEGVTKINSDAYFYLPTGDTVTRESRYGRSRGLIVGGGNSDTIEFINIASTGNAQDYGNLSATTSYVSALSSSTRGVYSRSRTPSSPGGDNTLEYSTLASTGNSIDFGDRTEAVYDVGALSSSIRGIIGGGYGPDNSDVIDYVTISSTGNALDFGNLTQARRSVAGLASPTRGCFAAGYQQPDTTTETNIIDYVTIASTGNAVDFGDLTAARWGAAPMASSTRGVFGGGIDPNALNVIDYITIASTGNANDFGDISQHATGRNTGISNSVRGVAGIYLTPAYQNSWQYITIQSMGNAQDFGESAVDNSGLRGGCSDSHGGLG